MTVTPMSILRLVALGLVAAIVQIAAISQISILGDQRRHHAARWSPPWACCRARSPEP